MMYRLAIPLQGAPCRKAPPTSSRRHHYSRIKTLMNTRNEFRDATQATVQTRRRRECSTPHPRVGALSVCPNAMVRTPHSNQYVVSGSMSVTCYYGRDTKQSTISKVASGRFEKKQSLCLGAASNGTLIRIAHIAVRSAIGFRSYCEFFCSSQVSLQ